MGREIGKKEEELGGVWEVVGGESCRFVCFFGRFFEFYLFSMV